MITGETHTGETHTIAIRSGARLFRLQVPRRNLMTLVEPHETQPAPDLATELRRALREPIGLAPFSAMIRGGERLLILVDDLTRETPAAEMLPMLLEELEVEKRKVEVTVLIALGTHRKMTPEEIEKKVGRAIVRRYRVLNHEWEDESALVYLGTTRNGTPLMVNRLIQETDLCLGIGCILPHDLAGWSGGAKIVQPGICGKATTYHTHLLSAHNITTYLGTRVNPLRREIEEMAQQVNLTGIINVVLNRHGEVLHVVAGDTVEAHRRGVELARAVWEVAVPARADIVVVSSYPKEIDFWQGNMGLQAAERIVKRGGEIILLASCSEGLSGQAEHAATMTALTGVPSRSLSIEFRRQGLHDLAALGCSEIAARCRELAWVSVISEGLSDADVTALGFERADDVDQAMARALERQGEHATIVVMPHGGEIFPVLDAERE